MNCSKCGSSEFVKAGFVIRRQRFKCKNCGTFYSVDQKTTGMSKDTKQLAFQMHVEGLGYNSIARIIGVSHVAVIKWIKSVDSNYKPESKNEKTVIINSISNDRTEKRTVGSKLFELYKTLSLNEKKRFADYIESPFFNANEDIIKLNQYIYSTCFAKKEADLEFKKIQWLFEGASDQKVKEVASLLLHHLEAFISQLKYDENKLLQREYLLVELRKRNMDRRFIVSTNGYLRDLQNRNLQDADYFFGRYVLEKELDYYFMKKEVRKGNESLQRKSDSLDTFYLSEKLKNLCEMVNRKNIISADYNIKMLDEVRKYIADNIGYFKTIPTVYIYYNILLTLIDADVHEHFKELKRSLDKNYKMFSKEEALQMYLHVQNYCIKKINRGEQEYLRELFSTYEIMLANEIIFEDKYLSQWDYKNIIAVGIKLKKFDWTKEFIEQYKDHIAPEFRKNAYEYNLALFYYIKKEYKSAVRLLQMVEFTDVYYHLDAKSMLLKIYYELNEVEPFYSLIDAYKVYLVRNKMISVYQRKGYQNLVKYTKRAFDLKTMRSSISAGAHVKAIERLKDQISANKKDANFSWLMEQVEEL